MQDSFLTSSTGATTVGSSLVAAILAFWQHSSTLIQQLSGQAACRQCSFIYLCHHSFWTDKSAWWHICACHCGSILEIQSYGDIKNPFWTFSIRGSFGRRAEFALTQWRTIISPWCNSGAFPFISCISHCFLITLESSFRANIPSYGSSWGVKVMRSWWCLLFEWGWHKHANSSTDEKTEASLLFIFCLDSCLYFFS